MSFYVFLSFFILFLRYIFSLMVHLEVLRCCFFVFFSFLLGGINLVRFIWRSPDVVFSSFFLFPGWCKFGQMAHLEVLRCVVMSFCFFFPFFQRGYKISQMAHLEVLRCLFFVFLSSFFLDGINSVIWLIFRS